jgi:hypothetical protein
MVPDVPRCWLDLVLPTDICCCTCSNVRHACMLIHHLPEPASDEALQVSSIPWVVVRRFVIAPIKQAVMLQRFVFAGTLTSSGSPYRAAAVSHVQYALLITAYS